MAAMPEAGASPAHLEGEQEALRQAFRASAPSLLMAVGGFYAVFSGTIFLNTDASWALSVWVGTMALGLLLAAIGWGLRRRPVPDGRLQPLVAGLGILTAGHLLLISALAEEADLMAYLAILLAGAGYFLLPHRVLLAVDVAAAAGWLLLASWLDVGVASVGTGYVAVGLAAGAVLNLAHRRLLRRRLAASVLHQGTLAASEERFRSLAETAQDAILLLDGEGRMTYLNPAGQRLFGLHAGEANGRFLAQHLGPGADPVPDLVGTHELGVQRRDGSVFPAELSLARSERDGVVVYTGVLRDITERNRAARATQEAAAKVSEVEHLREMNEFKTRFLNMAAHELNTPLTPLRLQLHLLKSEQMGPLSEKQSKAVGLLDRNVARLSGLVGELLEVARLQSGRLRLQVAPVAVDEAVDEVLESFGEAARRVGVQLGFDGPQGLTVQADRNRMVQVLFNLVSNAVKFTPSGGHVTVKAVDQGGHVQLAVSDSGLGLSPEQQSRLFQPFSQVHDPMAITASGTGLGLYISKGLVEAQGGSLQVASPGPGKGSTFTFTLPAAAAQPARPAPVRPADEDPLVRRLRELI